MAHRRTLLAALALATLLALAAPPSTATTPTTTNLTIDQLQPGGQRPAHAPPSVRAGGTYAEYAL